MLPPSSHRQADGVLPTQGVRLQVMRAGRFDRTSAHACPSPRNISAGGNSSEPTASRCPASAPGVVLEAASATEEQASAAAFGTHSEARSR